MEFQPIRDEMIRFRELFGNGKEPRTSKNPGASEILSATSFFVCLFLSRLASTQRIACATILLIISSHIIRYESSRSSSRQCLSRFRPRSCAPALASNCLPTLLDSLSSPPDNSEASLMLEPNSTVPSLRPTHRP